MRWWALRSDKSCILLVGAALGLGLEFGGCASGQEDTADAGFGTTDIDSATTDAPGTSSGSDSTVVQDTGSLPMPGEDAGPDGEPLSESDASEDSSLASGEDSGGGEDSSIERDSGGFDATVPDSSVPDSSAPDSSVPDSSAPDSSAPDSGALDSSLPEGGDAAVNPTFGNPVQINVTSILTIDTIATSATGGTALLPGGALTSMDGSNYDYYTANVATTNGITGGLPANGLFPANGTQSPVVQLHINDSSTAPNSLLLNAAAPNNGETFSFSVPAFGYTALQLYGTSTEGASTLAITLTYSDATTGSASVTIPDWSTGTATAPVFVLAGSLGRLGSGTFEQNYAFALYGANVTPNSGKSLASVTVAHSGTGRYVFYGATAW
jgi:hypothetical protein